MPSRCLLSEAAWVSQSERERRNPLYDSQQSTASQKSAKTSADPAETASSRFRSLFKRRDRAETS